MALAGLDVFILAGGRSSRMGRDKALVELDGRPLLGRVLDAAAPVAAGRWIVANDAARYAHFGVPILPDRWPGAAALGGIATAVHHARGERCLVLACDLPFLTAELLAFLIAVDPAADVVVPETSAEGLHPLVGVYSKRCLGPMERRIARGELKVAGFFGEVAVQVVGQAELAAAGFAAGLLANLNTPEELARARGPA